MVLTMLDNKRLTSASAVQEKMPTNKTKMSQIQQTDLKVRDD